MKITQHPQQWNAHLSNLIIFLFGIILILLSILFKDKQMVSVVLISIGTSIVASSIVSYLNSKYLIRKNDFSTMMDFWGIQAIYETRAEINVETNSLLISAKTLDICAMGLKGFRDAKGTEVKNRVSEGMRIRILTIDPKSKFLSVIDKKEGLALGATKATIDALFDWVSLLKASQLYDGQIKIATYDHYPYDFYFCLDDIVFTGPYQDKTSQQTITYKFGKKGNGSKQYRQYFESLWKNNYEEQ